MTIENRSDKVITAVKLGWKVYKHPEGVKISLSYCDSEPITGEVLLSGKPSLIQLGVLASKATSNVGIDPLPAPIPATNTVFVDRPFLTADDVKSLPLDEPTPKIKYTVVMYLSEIHFADGTTWEAVEQ